MITSKSGSKIRNAAFAIEGEKSRTKRSQRAEILTSTAADRVGDTKRKYNNQPNNHFIACLGRVSLRYWRDSSAVGLSVSHLVSLSAAFSRQLDHRLIVLNHIFSCVILPMELKLSHMKRMCIGRPPVYPYLVLVSCSDEARGPSC